MFARRLLILCCLGVFINCFSSHRHLNITHQTKISFNGENQILMDKNVYGKPLEICSVAPLTGYYRDGYCRTGPDDLGTHVMAAVMTKQFLLFTKIKGNDLSTPIPGMFPGLKQGDSWCLCASRWLQAQEAGFAPKLKLRSTNQKALKFTIMETLEKYSIDA